jgi:hypothetical protein
MATSCSPERTDRQLRATAPVAGESGSQNASEVRFVAPDPPSVTPPGGVRTGTAVSRGLAVGAGVVVVALGTDDDDDEGIGVELDVAPGSEEDGAAEADGASDGWPEGSPSLETNTRTSAATAKATTMAPSLRFMTPTIPLFDSTLESRDTRVHTRQIPPWDVT